MLADAPGYEPAKSNSSKKGRSIPLIADTDDDLRAYVANLDS